MSIYPIAYMMETIIFHHPTSQIHHHHHHLPLLTLCGRRVKQSQTVRSGRFESNLLTLQGRPNHTSRGYSQSHTCNISPFFPGCGSGSPTSTTRIHAPRAPSCTRMWPYENNVQRGWGRSPLAGPIRYLSLPITIFLGMWLVRSTTSTFSLQP